MYSSISAPEIKVCIANLNIVNLNIHILLQPETSAIWLTNYIEQKLKLSTSTHGYMREMVEYCILVQPRFVDDEPDHTNQEACVEWLSFPAHCKRKQEEVEELSFILCVVGGGLALAVFC
ncbi:hypothetical protein HHI36_008300 [Cryptolaemus montrouzieri]|uniref:Uncharacterized protein n=1 Tax=Cryptolaemus montrouzieri TaxID=559131 RepID=A0ABD2MS66_9CUCU